MYSKGGNMLHTIRQIVNDDAKWRSILQGLQRDFYHQTVTTQQVESYISQHAGVDLGKVFDQYLRTTKVPRLIYEVQGNKLMFWWDNVVDGFDMPVKISINGKDMWLKPTQHEQTITYPTTINSAIPDRNFYIDLTKAMTLTKTG